ncbi:hypothetical protein WJX81_003822 [Elliptochloris bilobata]|uniref:Uncharacterized protein n=1 Tax=Elliptochloris bilobata TaxID=381761 RepID=A0AAW1QVX9_9CHLO
MNSEEELFEAQDLPDSSPVGCGSEEEDSILTCSICLSYVTDLREKAVAEPCMHAFCVACLSQWLKLKRTCPLCKGRVVRYLYAITSERAYRVAEVPPTPPRQPTGVSSEASQTALLDLPPANPALTSRDLPVHRRPSSRSTSGTAARRAGSRAAALERPWGGAGAPLREPRPYYFRVQAQAQSQAAGNCALGQRSETGTPTEDWATAWRRHIYVEGLRAIPVGKAQPGMPALAAASRRRRVEAFVERELLAILRINDSIVRSYVLGLAHSHGLLGEAAAEAGASADLAAAAEAALRPFLHEHSATFYHELRCFAAAPYSVATYDRVSYGVFPCSSSLGGSILLILGYGYLLLKGAQLLSDGSEMLLEVLDPGVIGGLVLPILGALPDSLIIVVSGVGVSRETAQEQVSVGVGTLAGSTIMLLTIAWGGSLLFGRCDLSERGTAVNKTLTRRFDLWRTGVTTDSFTPKGAIIMAVSVLLYGIIQVPAFLGYKSAQAASLAGIIVCLATLAVYCVFQVAYPELQRRQIEHARQKRWRLQAAHAFEGRAAPFGSLVDSSGQVNTKAMRNLFDAYDDNKDGSIDEGELNKLLLSLSLSSTNGNGAETQRDYWMREFDDIQHNGRIAFDEFQLHLARWIAEKRRVVSEERQRRMAASRRSHIAVEVAPAASADINELLEHHLAAGEAQEGSEGDGDDPGSDDGDGSDSRAQHQEPTSRQVAWKAAALLTAGAALCAVISDPMVDAVSSFSKASGIPAFYVAFCVTPFASNASELVSSFMFARRKRRKNISLTFSQVYGAVTMNNTLCLGLFLLVIHLQDLPWTYSSEVAVTVVATLLIGLLGATRRTFAMVWALPVLLIYPLSILGVWGLDSLGWR